MADYTDNDTAIVGDYVAKEASIGFYEDLMLAAMSDNQYSDEFGKQVGGATTGDSIRVKSPAQFITTDDRTISASTIQGIKETTKVLTLDQTPGVHTQVSMYQATLEMKGEGNGYSKDYLQPMGKALAAKVDSIGFEIAAKTSQNSIVLETPYADADVLRQSFVQARSMLDKQLAPKGDRFTFLGSDPEYYVANSMIPLFHSAPQIEKAFKEGKTDVFGGLKWMCSNLVYTRTNGAGGTAGLTVTAYTEGASTITISDGTGFEVGDKITFTGNKLVHPQSKQSYGDDIQRAVLAVSGDILTIDPIWGPSSKGKQNAAAVPVATNAITVLGTSGESYLCCPVYQKKGLTVASADLEMPANVSAKGKERIHNITQRFIQDYEINGDTQLARYDSILVWKELRPEWCASVELKVS